MFGVSIRAWLAILIIGSFCFVCVAQAVVPMIQLLNGEPTVINIPQELNNLAIAVAGFYLGQKYQERQTPTK